MKWKNRRQSKNVDDRRSSSSSSGGGGFQMPSMQTLFFIFPLIKPLLKSKLGLAVVGLGAVAYMSGFNPLSLVGQSSSFTEVKDQRADDETAAFVATVLADTEEVWNRVFAQAGYKYKEPKMVLYRGETRSACGKANSQVGPFYCPADQTVYLDLGFFDELRQKFGASGDFAQAYILAHEVGHHIQNLQGTLEEVEKAKHAYGKTGSNQLQVKVELQADCYAGIWTNHAHKLFGMLESGDIDEAFNAANSIGDDRLQKQATGYVQPDAFTHGSSKQRMTWFKRGLQGGKLSDCQTFQ